MNARAYLGLSSAIFGLAALAHALRLLQGWSLHLGPLTVPPWASWVGLLAGATLCAWGLALYRRSA
ncbi:hypothetical protein MBSD_n1298 [Mizugakiibacter sediminis]|uniref:Uncharacterized protein n=1 Tax=Mizugakiibacter sediminis TaxID=1475481 RepID=A0A0K8QMN4_9GAMM|nr:hypothetical protein [Mizugakiibacter sediminis]GAP65996.1 hypothetical protein MBSD_n1298 [Mizugakiibacter sediminis]